MANVLSQRSERDQIYLEPMSANEAALELGIPETVLRRWAWDHVGPHNSGSRYTPKYSKHDLDEWIDGRVLA